MASEDTFEVGNFDKTCIVKLADRHYCDCGEFQACCIRSDVQEGDT